MPDDIITRDDQGNLAVNTVSATEANVPYNYDDCFTVDTNGRRALRIVGGSGGGEVDYSRLIIKSSTIPTAGSDEYRKVYMYVGETDANYTHGYIYECQKTAITYTGTVSFEAATLSGTTVACSGDDFAQFLTEAGADPTPIVSGTMTYDAGAGGWRLVGKDAEDNTVTSFLEYNEDYADAGFTFTGTPEDGDVIAFTCTVEEDTVTYGWVRIDVQPAPEALPDQTGQSGKFLTTNGSTASWDSVESLPTQTGQSGKFLTTDGTDASWGTIVGSQITVKDSSNPNSKDILAYNNGSSDLIKLTAYKNLNGILRITTGGSKFFTFSQNGLEIGNTASDQMNLGSNSVRLGTIYTRYITGANNDNNKITVPETGGTMVVATPPTADGTYVLKATVSSGSITLAWVAE